MKAKKSRGVESSQNRDGWLFISVVLILVGIFNVYPVVSSFLLSFQTGKGAVYHFNGLDNFFRLVKDKVFVQALMNTFTYFIFQVPVMIVLALAIATLLNDPKLKLKAFFAPQSSCPVSRHSLPIQSYSRACSQQRDSSTRS